MDAQFEVLTVVWCIRIRHRKYYIFNLGEKKKKNSAKEKKYVNREEKRRMRCVALRIRRELDEEVCRDGGGEGVMKGWEVG